MRYTYTHVHNIHIQIRIFFKCLPLVLLSTLASLGMLLPSIVYFIIVIFLGVQVILAYKRSTNWMALMCVLLMLFFYFRNNANIRLNSIAYMWILLCFPICLLFASQGGYINLSWMSMLMNLLRPVYCFYALFTIAMAVMVVLYRLCAEYFRIIRIRF